MRGGTWFKQKGRSTPNSGDRTKGQKGQGQRGLQKKKKKSAHRRGRRFVKKISRKKGGGGSGGGKREGGKVGIGPPPFSNRESIKQEERGENCRVI